MAPARAMRASVRAAPSTGRGAATGRGAGSATVDAGCEARTGSDTGGLGRSRVQRAAVGEGRVERDVRRRRRAVLAAWLGAGGGALEHRTGDPVRGARGLGDQREQQNGGEQRRVTREPPSPVARAAARLNSRGFLPHPPPGAGAGETSGPFPGSWFRVQRLRGPVMPVRRLLLLLLLGAPPVRAHSVTNELALGLNDSTPTSAQAANVADQLTFRFDLNEDWTLKVGAVYTYDPSSPPPKGAAFGASSAQIFSAVGRRRLGRLFTGEPVPRGVRVSGGEAARSTRCSAPRPSPPPRCSSTTRPPASARWQERASPSAEPSSSGRCSAAPVLDLSLGWTLLTTRQRVDAVVDGQGRPVSRQTLVAICRAIPNTRACQALGPYLAGGQETLNQLVANVALLHSLGPTTDVGLWASVYVYDKDPITAVPFTARASTSGFGSLDSGFPLAPLRWAISPSFQQQFGAFSVAPWYEYPRRTPPTWGRPTWSGSGCRSASGRPGRCGSPEASSGTRC